MNKRLVTTFTICGLLMATMFVLAAPNNNSIGIDKQWFFDQLGLVIAIAAGGLTAVFFVQKQTVKAITTLICGALFYVIVKNPEGTFNALGGAIKSLFGIQ